MARFATLLKSATVGVGVTIGALARSNAGVSWLPVAAGCVAFLACNLGMQPGQRVTRLRMVKFADGDRLPVVVVMALQTIGTKPPFVRILMATGASLREP